MEPKPNIFVLIRTYSAGVHAGTLASRDGQEVVLTDARRIWYWMGANTLNELSQNGPGIGSKVSEPVPEITLLQAIEIIPCSDEAVKAIRDCPWPK